MNNQRVAIFLDGSNLYHNLKKFNIKITFEEIIKRVETRRQVIDIFYYTALLDKSINEERYEEHKRFLDKIKKIPKNDWNFLASKSPNKNTRTF